MRKPLIALTPSHDTDNDDIKMRPTYLRAIKDAGGIPVVLPLEASEEDLRQLVDTMDGFLFTGGPDVHPFLFGEETLAHCGSVSPARDRMELDLISFVMERRKPILGICRGIQLLNIALGGTIWQDISSQVKRDFPIAHSQPFDYTVPSHTVKVESGSRLSRLADGSSLKVNSMHHQAVKVIAPGLTVTASASDGLVEALEMQSYPFFIAVQWHPEYLYEKDEAAAKLFQEFIEACK